MSDKSTPKTVNLSATSTVFLKYFLPTIYIVFFGTLMFVFLFAEKFRAGGLSPEAFKTLYISIFVGVIVLMYFTIFKLKRVEVDGQYLYITNYVKIFRYPFSNIEKITAENYGIWLVMRVHLKESGHFGKKSTFLANRKKIRELLASDPEMANELRLPDNFSLRPSEQ